MMGNTLTASIAAHHANIAKSLAPIRGQPGDLATEAMVVTIIRTIEKSIAQDRAAVDATVAGLRFYAAFPLERYVDAGDIEMTVHATDMSEVDAIRSAELWNEGVEFCAVRCTWKLFDYVDQNGVDDDFRWHMNADGLVELGEAF